MVSETLLVEKMSGGTLLVAYCSEINLNTLNPSIIIDDDFNDEE